MSWEIVGRVAQNRNEFFGPMVGKNVGCLGRARRFENSQPRRRKKRVQAGAQGLEERMGNFEWLWR